MGDIPYVLFSVGNIAMGFLNCVWGQFDPAHQPIQTLGLSPSITHAVAYGAGALLVAGGAAMFRRDGVARIGLLTLAAVNLAFGICWTPRLYSAVHYLGLSVPVLAGVLGGICRQLMIVTAAVLAYVHLSSDGRPLPTRLQFAGRLIFGISAIIFGVNHLAAIGANLSYVPTWMPLGQALWVSFTGFAFVLAGVAIIGGVLDRLAAWLLGDMLLLFAPLSLMPYLFSSPHDIGSWGGNIHELVLVAAAWLFARPPKVSAPQQLLGGEGATP